MLWAFGFHRVKGMLFKKGDAEPEAQEQPSHLTTSTTLPVFWPLST